MRLVVADTSPIFYPLSVGQIELLPRLFQKVFVPDAVHRELCHPTAPAVLRAWLDEHPSWLEIIPVDPIETAVPSAGPLRGNRTSWGIPEGQFGELGVLRPGGRRR